jgi:sporulation protein YlmC with PRC-barrel domain
MDWSVFTPLVRRGPSGTTGSHGAAIYDDGGRDMTNPEPQFFDQSEPLFDQSEPLGAARPAQSGEAVAGQPAPAQGTPFAVGSEVVCSDAACGKLARVVVDPVARSLTHLVVQPAGAQPGRLVSVSQVKGADPERIELLCSQAEFDQFEISEETHFLSGAPGQWGYPQDEMLSWPFYGLPTTSLPMMAVGVNRGAGPSAVTFDRIPPGEVDIRRGEHVHARDGDIGRVRGLVVHPEHYSVTHILLDEGHLWGKKQVAIPMTAVESISDGVHLTLTKDEVKDLPPVDLDG